MLKITLIFIIQGANVFAAKLYTSADMASEEPAVSVMVNSYGGKMSASHVIRCSRRYNPGSCAIPARTVWTYNWQIQNCTTRMGCRVGTRSNRFPSHWKCMRVCAPLVGIYLRFLEDRNKTDQENAPDLVLPLGDARKHNFEFPVLPRSSYLAKKMVEEDYQAEDRALQDEYDAEDWSSLAAHMGVIVNVDVI